jgi:predicted RNA-binding protein YlqC (UPF0109 family)
MTEKRLICRAVEEFLEYILHKLVEYPEEVVITKSEGPRQVTFHVAMRKSDVGRIIGRGGHTVHALRTLLQAAAHKKGLRANLEIIE